MLLEMMPQAGKPALKKTSNRAGYYELDAGLVESVCEQSVLDWLKAVAKKAASDEATHISSLRDCVLTE